MILWKAVCADNTKYVYLPMAKIKKKFYTLNVKKKHKSCDTK